MSSTISTVALEESASSASNSLAGSPAKPFLRWAGGKNWMVKYLPDLIKIDYKTYHEPFLGGGSVFFYLNPRVAFLSDANEELIDAYLGIRDNVEQVISFISRWQVSEDQYYAVRALSPKTTEERAARFIYLNRTSFNGIYRVNRKGEYNVPWGKKDAYKFNYNRIRLASSALQGVDICCQAFEKSLADVQPGDLVFLDPPYTVSHNNNGFIEYNKKLFSLDDQYALRKYIDSLNELGAYFILTNAAHDKIKEIFNGVGTVLELQRHCGLGGRNAMRRNTGELIFTNIPGISLGGRE